MYGTGKPTTIRNDDLHEYELSYDIEDIDRIKGASDERTADVWNFLNKIDRIQDILDSMKFKVMSMGDNADIRGILRVNVRCDDSDTNVGFTLAYMSRSDHHENSINAALDRLRAMKIDVRYVEI
jgi:hypothetical protein